MRVLSVFPAIALLAADLLPVHADALAADAVAQSFRYRPVAHAGVATTTDRIIVKLKPGWTVPYETMPSSHATTLSVHAGTALAAHHAIDDRTHVMSLGRPMDVADVQAIADSVATHPSVEYAEPDRRRFPAAVPNDPAFVSYQWYLYDYTSGTPNVVAGTTNWQAAMHVLSAWNLSMGSPTLTVAVLDTGILPHVDLPTPPNAGTSWSFPYGYDFVGPDAGLTGANQFLTANDGDAWDSNPADPGDWVTAQDNSTFMTVNGGSSCVPTGQTHTDSDWHGTSVASIIAAKTNNGIGLAGVAPGVNLLPVRVLGKCGGYDSDISTGVLWAAGLQVGNSPVSNAATPLNPHPAKILNMSLGGPGACSQTTQNAINQALGMNASGGSAVAIVTAAGNESAPASSDSPGNCTGVINVAAVTQNGSLASYSNRGTGVTLSAPGGSAVQNCIAQSDWIYVATNTGTTTPSSDTYVCFAGTSASTPLVSGVVALMMSVNSALTATQVSNILKATAQPFPTGASCNTSICGYGMVDALAAVTAAQNNPNVTPAPTPTPAPTSTPASGGGSSGGGGGCAADPTSAFDPTLAALALLAIAGLARRRAASRMS